MESAHLIIVFIACITLQSCQSNTVSNLSNVEPLKVLSNDTLPFTLTSHNNIVVDCVINGADSLKLMFHTDAHYISITNEALLKTNSIVFSDTTDVESWGGGGEASFSKHNKISLGDIFIDSLTIWTTERSGHFTDGKFGPTVLNSKVFEINYDEEILVFHEQLPINFDAEEYSQFPLDIRNGSMYINAKSIIGEDTINQDFLIHTGFSGAMLFDDEFSNKYSLSSLLETVSESELSDSYGNKIKTKKSILPKLIVSDIEIENVLIGFFDGSIGRQKISVIGSELLKRFDLIFDLQNQILYLKRNKYFKDPFPKK